MPRLDPNDPLFEGVLRRIINQELDGSTLSVRVRQLQNRALPSYLTADLPSASAHEGEVVYVPDGAAGSKFQGSDGSSWVSLG